MELQSYPWSEHYGWIQDKYGISWQLMYQDGQSGISPAFLFQDKVFGKGDEAIGFYTSLFKGKIESLTHDPRTKTVLHSRFKLGPTPFTLMEGQSDRTNQINPAISFEVFCKTQTEIDHYWDALSKGGKPGPCGWIEDKFGVSWQIVPADLPDWTSDPRKTENVMKVLLTMKKLDLERLRLAAS
jgi:predicted 3-demethylubiquinone-9 3-methyltransferase (glyoxalase superfamily)